MAPVQTLRICQTRWTHELIDQADGLLQTWQLISNDLSKWTIPDLIQVSVDTLNLVNRFYYTSSEHGWEQEALNDHDSMEGAAFGVAKTSMDTLWKIRDIFQEIRDGPPAENFIQEWQWNLIKDWARRLEMRRPDEKGWGEVMPPVQEEKQLVLR